MAGGPPPLPRKEAEESYVVQYSRIEWRQSLFFVLNYTEKICTVQKPFLSPGIKYNPLDPRAADILTSFVLVF